MPSPNATTRLAENWDSTVPPPQAASRRAEAPTAASRARRNNLEAMDLLFSGETGSLTRMGKGPVNRGLASRGTPQAILHAFPLGRVGRRLYPDELDASGVEFAQHRKKLARGFSRIVGH